MTSGNLLSWLGLTLTVLSGSLPSAVVADDPSNVTASDPLRKDVAVTSKLGPFQLLPWVEASSAVQFADTLSIETIDAVVVVDLQATTDLVNYINSEEGPDEIPMIFGCGVNDEILLAIQQEHLFGTVTTQPYEYGYRAIERLALRKNDPQALSRGQIRFANRSIIGPAAASEVVRQFADIKRGRGYKISMDPKIENSDFDVELILEADSRWWDLVEAGCQTAAQQFSIGLLVRRLPRDEIRALEAKPMEPACTTVIGFSRDNDLILVLHWSDNNGPRPVNENAAEVFRIRCDYQRNGSAIAKMVQQVFPQGAKLALLGHPNANATNGDVVRGFERQLKRTPPVGEP